MTSPRIYTIEKQGKLEQRIDNSGGDIAVPSKEQATFADIKCLLSRPEKRILWHLVKTWPKDELQVANLGHADGGSAFIMATAVTYFKKKGIINSVDMFRYPRRDVAQERANKAGFDPSRVVLYKALSFKQGRRWKEEGRTFDITFIDAGHDYNSVKADWEIFSQIHAGPGSIIAFHDTNQLFTDRVITEGVGKDWELLHHVDRIKAFKYVG